jgi:hypothetical protein
MNGEEILKLIGMFVVGMFVIYYFISCIKVQSSVIEGLTNATDTTATTSYSSGVSGIAGSAANYAANIKAQTIQLQDEMLISKYRKDYESAIINMDDYVSMLMLQQVLSIDANSSNQKDNIELLNNLNILKSSKDALNVTMKYIDTQ